MNEKWLENNEKEVSWVRRCPLFYTTNDQSQIQILQERI